MKDKILQIEKQCLAEIDSATDAKQLQDVKVKYLGKSGELTTILRGMKDVAPEQRREVGSLVNQLRNSLEEAFSKAEENFAQLEMQAKLNNERVDISITHTEPLGTIHPINAVTNEIFDLMTSLGFEVLEGPEIETEYYNFSALNIPSNHPARDLQDTFYITEDFLLRTHTSPMQARHMEKTKPPIKMICPGKVYRPDNDASHSPVFHQIEGLVIDENITLCDLKGTLEYLAKNLFDKETKVRFRPSYFPFTEPSVEVDLTCSSCHGSGCSLCKGTGWIELLGAGMVNPKVLENCNIDSKKYRGFAFGIGLDRVAMIKYGIPNIRLLFENDVRFLQQFKK